MNDPDPDDDTRIPWGELTQTQREDFALLCSTAVEIDSVDDAEQYYGNKEKLLEDAFK